MRIRITQLPRDTSRFRRDDIDLSHYCVGEVYEVGSTVGTYLIVMGVAAPEMRHASRTVSPDAMHAGARHDHRTTVLLVDDIVDQLDMYEMALSSQFNVLRASRGQAAFALACLAVPDIIILDVMLPDVNGVTLCQRLKATPVTAAIPVLLLTAYETPAVKLHGIEAGAAAVLSKPCPADKLILAIDGFFGDQAGE